MDDESLLSRGRKIPPPTSDNNSGPEKVDVVIIGSGPAGLAVCGALSRLQSVKYLALESQDSSTPAWRKHYRRLHLHTHRDDSYLPYLPFPSHYPIWVSRQQLLNYFDAYRLLYAPTQVRVEHTVESVSWTADKGYELQVNTPDGRKTFVGKNVVVACGENSVPNIPVFPGQESFQGPILHTSQYLDGEPFRGKRVLLVGYGNSNGEIALDLWERDAIPMILQRSPMCIIKRDSILAERNKTPFLPKLLSMLGQKFVKKLARVLDVVLSKHLVDTKKYGIPPLKDGYGPCTRLVATARPMQIDVGTLELIEKKEITLIYGVVKELTKKGAILLNKNTGQEEEHEFDAIVLGTGHLPSATFTKFLSPDIYNKVVGQNGFPRIKGSETEQKGLFFVGYDDIMGRLHMIHDEAIEVAKQIGRAAKTHSKSKKAKIQTSSALEQGGSKYNAT
mmetsp:Transcript_20764/g.34214  ORF Transcript_20764/g.34214 Transcript_20764/m.34214 type:complete len:448 (+) Transcript_20764:151-1494(+)|eukprot:CAMPEP_0184645366 /NCGR_PEP_ID=MMETSP0308-20130426/1837_1 /TAXON_ID=38269 /ORGANISM="Gloeochaete witrockiana, Strain SAG 46.84" /LENGTH=447 /DNA_ID=CAMNT_0027074293 /DNA_START=133 /DNA_END=1476 /DNA_ORIENTATION=+